MLTSYNDWLERQLQPSGQEFVEAIATALLATVRDYEFLIKIEGLDLKDQDGIDLGSVRILRSNRALLENVKFGGHLDLASVYEQFKDGLWLIGVVRGSSNVASQQSEYRATLAVGMLAVCGALLYRGAIWRSRVRAAISPLEHRRAVSSLRWEVGGDNPSLSRKWGGEQDLPLASEQIAYLVKVCFLKELASMPDRQSPKRASECYLRSMCQKIKAHFVEPILLHRAEKPSEGEGRIYKVELDGSRAHAIKSGGPARVAQRQGFQSEIPAMVQVLSRMPDETVIDGEIVAVDESGSRDYLSQHAFKPVSRESVSDSNAFRGKPAMTAISGAARIRVTVLRGGILDLGICFTTD